MYNIGLVGTGAFGQRYLEAISTIIQEQGKDIHVYLCNRHGSYAGQPCLTDYKDVMIPGMVGGVIVCANPTSNLEMLRYASFQQIPVLVEKPVALYLDDIYKIEKMRNRIMVDYIHLFNPRYLELKEAIKGKKITKILSLGYNNGPFRNFSGFFDYAPHDLSMCMDLVPGEFQVVGCPKATRGDNGGILTQITCQAGETEIVIKCGNGGKERRRQLLVFTEDGQGYVYDDEYPTKEPLKNVVSHFLSVIDGSPVKPSFDLTVRIHKLMYQIGRKYE